MNYIVLAADIFDEMNDHEKFLIWEPYETFLTRLSWEICHKDFSWESCPNFS